jgi:hypothetical protein
MKNVCFIQHEIDVKENLQKFKSYSKSDESSTETKTVSQTKTNITNEGII